MSTSSTARRAATLLGTVFAAMVLITGTASAAPMADVSQPGTDVRVWFGNPGWWNYTADTVVQDTGYDENCTYVKMSFVMDSGPDLGPYRLESCGDFERSTFSASPNPAFGLIRGWKVTVCQNVREADDDCAETRYFTTGGREVDDL